MTRHAARARRLLPAAVLCVLAFALYAAGVPENPPGFYIDESSIAYNALTVAESGRDEYGEAWPLYFRAFGDYKNPTYVYLLAAVFKVMGPSVAVARLLSATLGALAALLLGLLAARVTGRREACALVAFSALLTPWLYESSRLVFEVAAYPAVCALFLLALWRARARESWRVSDALAVAASLALLTYTYSVGRLLGPLLAAGLALFVTRRNLARVALAWGAYAVALAPLAVYALRHPGALAGRFRLISYVTPESGFAEDARAFVLRYAADVNPWRWLVTGERNIRDHLPDAPALLLATVLLAAAGVLIVLRGQRREAWWRFQFYALAASVVPAALTLGDFPQLRLIAFPVFLHVFTVPAVARLVGDAPRGRLLKVALYAVVGLLLAQGAHFQWRFHARPPERWYVFDARFPRAILAPALEAARGRPVYLQDPPGRSGYIQALWHGALGGVAAGRFVRLAPGESPPAGAVVVSTAEDCSDCRPLARSTNFLLYAVLPTELEARPAPLRAEGFRAHLSSRELPAALPAAGRQGFEVIVRNVGFETWPAVGDAAGRHAVSLRARWLRPDGSPVVEGHWLKESAARILYDMERGDTAGIRLEVNAPAEPGDYVLEVFVAQEGAARFGARDAGTLRAAVKVSREEGR